MAIYFYSSKNDYFEFSNFSQHGFTLKEKYWSTVEHYFQAQKFTDSELAEKIRLADSPKQAKQLGQTRTIPLRPDWEQVKDDIMREAVLAKFSTHETLKKQLVATGDEQLIENAPKDYYWGCGADGSGKNRLGEILMETRDILRQESD